MPIRPKLTTRAPGGAAPAAAPKAAEGTKREHTEAERQQRKERVAKAKDALARSVALKGDHVGPARTALKQFLQRLNEPRQPDDAAFEVLLEAPFRVPEKRKERRPF